MRGRVHSRGAHCHRRGLVLGTAAEGAVRVRPKKMPLLQRLRRETEREATRDRAEWGGQVRVRGRGCPSPQLLARGGGSGWREVRASEAVNPPPRAGFWKKREG